MTKTKYDFDTSVRPQDDFFGYINGNWIKNNPIPETECSWNTFNELREKSLKEIRKIINNTINKSDDLLNHEQKLLKTFFSTAFSYSTHEKNNLKSLLRELQKVHCISNLKDLSNYLGYVHKCEIPSFWGTCVDLDDKNSKIHVLRFYQSGLGLPSRDYYLDKNEKMKKVRSEYKLFFSTVNDNLPIELTDNWDIISKVENRLAQASWTEADVHDAEKNYNRFTIQELELRFPKLDWTEYFNGLGWTNPSDNIVINQPSFIDEIYKIISELSIDDIKQYLLWHLVKSSLGRISEKTAKISFDFHGRVISGNKKIDPVWKRAISQANYLVIGEVLGKEYAARHFPESSKSTVLDMVEDLRSAYHRRIDKVTWMQESTKKRAHIKLDKIKVLIGYPSIWHDLDGLNFSENNHFDNILTARTFFSNIELQKIGQEPPIEEWHMNAHQVNAYFDFNQLVVCFPAGILQAPFFDPNVSYATNLGGIGTVIGHEFTHGFDDNGSKFDENGEMNQWQSDAEIKTFKKLANAIVKQADSYEVIPGTFLNGELILGEIIADIGGVVLATETITNKTDSKNITNDLRELYENYTKVERGTQRDEFAILTAKTDPHPPSRFRVNCVLPHIDDFYTTFNVTAGDRLYIDPKDRVNIW